MPRSKSRPNEDLSACVRAAWLHYAGGLTQGDVAKRMGITSVKAHRLITRANQEGLVKVSISGEVAECAALEIRLAEKYSLDYCEVVPDLGEEDLPIRALGIAGSKYLLKEIASGTNDLIGLGHGRTLAACVSQMPKTDAKGTMFVSLLGSLTRNFSANAHDVMHAIAERTGAGAYVIPVPFLANSEEDREIISSQHGIPEVMKMAANSKLKFVGIGSSERDAQLVSSGMVEQNEIDEVKTRGGVGELLGHFFDEHGEHLETKLTKRTLTVSLQDIENSRIVAVAGGKAKIQAISSVLKSGHLNGLITDELTAITLLKGDVDV